MGNKQELEEESLNQEAPSGEELSYEEEFEALWGKDELEEPATSEPTGEEEESEGEDAPEQAADGGEGQDAPNTATKAPTTAVPAAPQDPYQWIDSLPEEVREQARQLKHAATSHQGRATAFQRRVEDLQQELDRVRTAPRPAQPADHAKASDPAAPELPKKFLQLKEDFPEFAEAVQEIRDLDRQRYEEKLKETITPLKNLEIRQAKEDFNRAVDAAAAEIFNTAETGVYWKDVVNGEDFREWLSLQPKSVQQAARVPDPREAAYVLTRYEEDYKKALAELQKVNGLPGDPDSAKSTQADKVKQKRVQRQQKSVTPGSKPAAADPRNAGGGDYYAEFDAMWG